MDTTHASSCIAFEGSRRIARGPLAAVALRAKAAVDRGARGPVLIFDDPTSALIEVDFRGTPSDVAKRVARLDGQVAGPGAADATSPEPELPRGPGRPRLGVVAREVTLLPRHWEWLGTQRGGASVALRKLVDEARRANEGADRMRVAQEAAYRFMSAMSGDRPGFEEATRALFAGQRKRFEELVADWPVGVREHSRTLAARALGG